uniref:Amino acid transporter transmembrane domain-containing protein n=2 Tax=Auxenochlorella protothecoides TaxID=3075 RepID=A0A1D2AFK5_AUXPR
MSSPKGSAGGQFLSSNDDALSGSGSPLAPDTREEWHGWTPANMKHLMSATLVLTLGIIGSAILPVASAFATTGAVLGIIVALVVGATNVYTCRLLIRGAQYTGTRDYESFAHAVGGPWFKFFTEFSIIILLLGTIIAAMIQCGEVGAAGLTSTWPSTAPGFLTYRGGLAIVVFCTLCIITPLSLLPSMRKLETIGGFGIIIVWFLMFVIIVYSCKNGLPALKDGLFGGFAVVNQGSISDVANAFSTFGFAFYLQAIMMPLLSEMPPGRTGSRITNAASAVTVIGVAATTYIVTAFFGAAMYGYDNTASNILDNQWFGSYTVAPDGTLVPGNGGGGQFTLNFLMTMYLAISLPPIVFACCIPVNNWMVMASRGRYENLRPFTRKCINLAIVISITLAVSLAAPSQSGNVITATGATGVCLVSYLIPVLSHLLLVFGRGHCQRPLQADSASVAGGAAFLKSADGSPLAGGSLGEAKAMPGEGERARPADDYVVVEAPGAQHLEPPLDPETASGTVTNIGYFALPRHYHAPRHSRLHFWAVEVTLPILVCSLGVLFSVATLVLLHNTIAQGE